MMEARTMVGALLTLTAIAACETPASEIASPIDPPTPAAAKVALAASGTFQQTGVTSVEVGAAGPNTIIEQSATGVVSGTLSGTYEDDVRVIIHPNGTFTTEFTIVCQCEVDGAEGVLEMRARDRGAITGPNTASFDGTATIVAGSGDLTGMHGVLRIEGEVDLTSGLSVYSYHGQLR